VAASEAVEKQIRADKMLLKIVRMGLRSKRITKLKSFRREDAESAQHRQLHAADCADTREYALAKPETELSVVIRANLWPILNSPVPPRRAEVDIDVSGDRR